MSTTSPLLTAKQLEASPPQGRWERLKGELRKLSPAGGAHGWIVGQFTVILGGFIRQHGLGWFLGAETGFLIEQKPDAFRAPDFAFLCAVPAGRPQHGYLSGAPDLSVEVISPNETATAVGENQNCGCDPAVL